MTWTLETDQLDIVNPEIYYGLPLFSAISDNKPVSFVKLDPQSGSFSKKEKPAFVSTVVNNLPTPTKSSLFILEGLFDTSLTQVYNINVIEEESYFQDLVESKTYILTTNSSLEVTSTIELLETDFLRSDSVLSYSFDEAQSFTLETVTSEGLVYTEGTPEDSHSFSFEDSADLEIYITPFCSPRIGSYINLEVSNLVSEVASSSFEVLVFDLGSTTLSSADSLTWQGKSYMYSLDIQRGSLLFNRVIKVLIAIC
jgi:hypothetical protein